MEVKSAKFECKVDMDARTIEGYAAVFNNVDNGWDKILKGAFKKTIKERFKGQNPSLVKLLWQHWQPLGMPTMLAEDTHGLLFKAIVSKTILGDESLILMDDGVVSQMSFGYDVVKKEYVEEDGKGEIRILKELKLYEISPVTFPMNEETAITAVQKMLETAPIDPESKSLLMLAARLGKNNKANKESSTEDDLDIVEMLGNFDQRAKALFDEIQKMKALIESGQPEEKSTGINNEPLNFNGDLLEPLRRLKQLL